MVPPFVFLPFQRLLAALLPQRARSSSWWPGSLCLRPPRGGRRRGAGARRGVRLDSPAVVLHRGAPMQLIGLAVVLAVSLTLGSLTVEAQTGKVWRIGLMHVGLDHVPPSLVPLREELRALGYEDGRNIRLDFRNLADQAAANITAQQFVRDQVDLIVAFEEQAMRGVKAATSAIPVVFLHLVDPVADGFVESLAHPGGNVTGFITWAVSPSKQI